MSLSPAHNESLPPTSYSSLPISETRSSPEPVTSTTAQDGSTTRSPESHHGSSISAATNNHNEDSTTAPPSISGSTATGTTTTTMVSGASSTSSPPSLFPPLAHHGGIGAGAGIAPPQLSVTNAVHHAHFTQHPQHAHGHAGPSHHGGQAHSHAGPSRPSHSIPPSSTSSAPHHTGIYHPSHQAHPPQQQMQVSTPREIESARNAVVASIGNMLDRELSGRATQLHANNAAIEKQEREMGKTLESFRKENDKLAKLAKDHTKKIKEIGNVQNWAEMLEREFLILESTLKMANRTGRRERREGEAGNESDRSGSWSGSASWSGSYSGSGSYAGSEAGGDGKNQDGGEGRRVEDDAGILEAEGVNGTDDTTIPAAPNPKILGEQQADRLEQNSQGAGSSTDPITTLTAASLPDPVQVQGPTILRGKGKERDGDIQLALAEAMETSLLLDTDR
ncbi:hypothetical protein V8F33_001412 [Rhypophila sp. PSN 637]